MDDNQFLNEAAADFIGNLIEEVGRVPHVLNHKRVREFERAYKLICEAVKESKVAVTYNLRRINIGMACITIIGKDLWLCAPKVFVEAARFASNMDIYPRTDGTVRIDLTFYEMATVQEEE